MRDPISETHLRMIIREIIQEDFSLGSVFGGIKSGIGKAYDTVADTLGIKNSEKGILGTLDSLSADERKQKEEEEREAEDERISMLEDEATMWDIPFTPLVATGPKSKESWKGRLGTELGGINFHKIQDDKNNYRAGIKPKYTRASVDFFKELNTEYGIDKVITLAADNGNKRVPGMVQAAGMESIYLPCHSSRWPNREEFERIKSALREGNTLVHCTHGADRTGAIVGRYYIEELGWPVARAISETKKYKGHKYDTAKEFLIGGPERDPDQNIKWSDVEKETYRSPTIDTEVEQKIVNAYPKMRPYVDELIRVSESLMINPIWLANVINFESRGGDPKAVNSTSGATGLIQFMPRVARRLGTSTSALYDMSGRDQMKWVEEYLSDYKGMMNSQEDVYMAVFYPKAIGNPDFRFKKEVVRQNAGIRTPRDYAALANSKASIFA